MPFHVWSQHSFDLEVKSLQEKSFVWPKFWLSQISSKIGRFLRWLHGFGLSRKTREPG